MIGDKRRVCELLLEGTAGVYTRANMERESRKTPVMLVNVLDVVPFRSKEIEDKYRRHIALEICRDSIRHAAVLRFGDTGACVRSHIPTIACRSARCRGIGALILEACIHPLGVR